MLLRYFFVSCSLSILIVSLPQNTLAMDPDERDFKKKSLNIQSPSSVSESKFLGICEDLVHRDAIPLPFQKDMNLYLTVKGYRQYLNSSLPHADVLRRDLDFATRYPAINRMLQSDECFTKAMISLGIIYNEIEPIELRIASAHLLNKSKALNSMNMRKVMTDLLEEVFEIQYNRGKLVKLDEDIVEEFLKGAQILPYDSDTRKKVVRRVAEMSHLTPERRIETLFYLPRGEERDSLLLPFLINETLKFDPKYRLDGIFGLRNGEERESFLCAFAANPRMPIEHRLEALMESSAPLDVKCEFFAQCLNNKHRFSSRVVAEVEELQWSLVMDEDPMECESDESYGAEEINI
ncbi:MAG: hypothetical protein K2Y08_05445 [Alphaproteobacteria bacterium]|nr:hypothetical protein [Alphaproteobacteria bacterium]